MPSDIRLFDYKTLKTQGLTSDRVRFIIDERMKNPKVWEEITQPFVTREDRDGMWRGEYFGKEMRGATLVYKYTGDEELYTVLTEAVKNLLACADEYGRICTYDVENEFCGWDMWCRKYVLTGVLHYYDICKDDEFKKEILDKLTKHADYIVSKIGKKEGQISITSTSSWWGCVNSCTILEPMLELYKKTGKVEYFEFAKYIVSTGGSSECDFFKLALANNLMPYQYPVVKAYETMSYFEGLLAYYELTAEKDYLTAVVNFTEAVNETDMTIIGCAGCTHELFDCSTQRQTEYSKKIMQETCVTVTWIRLCARLFALTGKAKYIDRIEKSGFNALYGSLNTNHVDQYNMRAKKYVKAMPFDSYSPLYMNTRGRGVGGYQEFAGGGYCGCCVAIGSCGIALMALLATVESADGVVINYLFEGEVKTSDKSGKSVTLSCKSKYPSENKGTIRVDCDDYCQIGMFVRVPAWSGKILVDGKEYDGEYVDLSGYYKNGVEIEIEYLPKLTIHRLNGKIAFTYGAITLAGDEDKTEADITAKIAVDDNTEYSLLPKNDGEIIRMSVKLQNGDNLLLTDYQSCGKNWRKNRCRITAWFNQKKSCKIKCCFRQMINRLLKRR